MIRNGSLIKILVADDHKILRDGLAGLLREEEDIELVGEACDGQMAVELNRKLRPDVIIMDITMPRLDGVEATRQVVRETPDVRVIGLSMHEKEDMALSMRRAGAVEYLTKGCPAEELIAAIRAAVATEA